jgi:hypothetical protein
MLMDMVVLWGFGNNLNSKETITMLDEKGSL